MRLLKTVFAFSVVGALIGATPAPALAGQSLEDSEPVVLVVTINGKQVPLDPDFLTSTKLHLQEPAEPIQGEVSTDLIDWNQWYGCFSLNNVEDVFATYYTPSVNQQPGREIELKCGESDTDTTTGFGYKHIRDGKESAWQAKFDGAQAAGWDPSSAGMESWDDLMSASAGTAIMFPSYTGGNINANTTCVVTRMSFVRSGSGEVYAFNARAGYANNSSRLITAFPQSGTDC